MSKTTKSFPYLCAINILQNRFKYIITNELEQSEHPDEIILPSEEINPEKMLIKKEEYESLSIEAREIIQTLINCPEEIFEVFKTEHIKKISKRQITKIFADIWQSEYIAKCAIQEIVKWVKTL